MLNSSRLIELRKNKGFTQDYIAKKLGIDRTTYVKYEKSNVQPANDVLANIALLYDVSTDYLLDLTDDPMPSSKKNSGESATDIKWQDLKISFYDGDRNLTQKQKDEILRFIKFTIMEDGKNED